MCDVTKATAFVVGFLCLLPCLPAQSITNLNETFSNQTFDAGSSAWTLGSATTTQQPSVNYYLPNLTATAPGNGALSLTSAANNEATFAYYNSAFNATNASVYATFQYSSYGGSGADGISFFLFDASVMGTTGFVPGAFGGSLGYAQKSVAMGGDTTSPGLAGGYIGVGIDTYGNFSNPTEGRVGGPGATPSSIDVRGPASSNYNYLTGTSTLVPNLDDGTNTSTSLSATVFNTVTIALTPTNQLSVYLERAGSSTTSLLYTIDLSAYTRPDQLMFGFAAGTGGATDNHLIRDLVVSTATASLWKNTSGDGTWGNAANWNPNFVPSANANILFDNSTATTAQTINVGAGQTRVIGTLSIDAPFAYTVDPSANNGTLEFQTPGASGIYLTSTHGAAATQTVNSSLKLDNAIEIKNGTSSALTIAGTVTTNGYGLTLDGAGTGTTTVSGVISGGGSVTKNDSGTAVLSGTNSYSGGTTLNAGTLVVGSVGNTNALGTSSVVLNGGTLASSANSTISNALTLQGNAALAVTGAGTTFTSNGTLTQAGGSYTLNMGSGVTQGAVNLTNSATAQTLTVQVDSGSSTISGAIANGGAGAGSLAKTGAGTLQLNTASSYTGTTTISNGTLQLGASNVLPAAGNVSIDASGTLNLNAFSQKIGNLTALAGGATIDFGTTPGANTLVFGTYTAPASGVLVVNNFQQGTDTLATTGAGQNVSTIYISGIGAATEAGATSGTLYGNAYALTPVVQTGVIWDGSTSANWGTGTNWTGNAIPTNTQIAVFDNTGAGRPAVTLNGNNTIAGLRFDTTAPSYTISGTNTLTLTGAVPYVQQKSAANETLSFTTLTMGNNTVFDFSGAGNLTVSSAITGGAYSLIKDGTGTGSLILSGANTFTGGVYINNGILQMRSNAALGNGGTTTIAAGAALEVANNITANEPISVIGSGVGGAGAIHNVGGANTLSGAMTLTGATTIAADTGTTLNLTGGITGTNPGLTLNGAGTFTIGSGASTGVIALGTGGVTINNTGTTTFAGTAANTYSGATTVNSGTLILGKSANVISVNGNLIIGDGAGAAAIVQVVTGGGAQIAANSAVTINSDGTLNLNGQSNTVAQLNASSAAAQVTLGAGTLTVGGNSNLNSSYAGTITGTGGLTKAGSGALTLTNASSSYTGATAINTGVVDVTTGGALGTSAVTVAGGASLQVTSLASNLTNTVNLNGSGVGGAGALESTAGTNTLTGNFTLQSNARIQADTGSTLNLTTGTLALGTYTLNAGGGGNTSVSRVISGTGGVTKDGTGTLVLSGANSYTGATTINNGTLQLGASNTLTNTTAVTVAGGATFDVNGKTDTIGSLAGAGNVTLGVGALTAGNDNTTTTYSGVISGSGTLTKSGTGTLTLSGANTMTGAVTLNGTGTSTLTLTNSTGQAFGNVSGITINAGNILTLGASNQINDSANLALAGGTFNVNGSSETLRQLTMSASSTIDFLNDGSVLRFNGVIGSISGLGTLTGTLTIADWAGSFSGNGSEQFVVYSTSGAPAVGGITFAGFGATTTIARGDLGAGYYEILPTLAGIQWNVDSATPQNWATAANWSPNTRAPTLIGDTAILGNTVNSAPLNNNITISMGATNATVGMLIFNNASNLNYTIGTGTAGRLDFNVASGTAQIIVDDNGSHTIAANGQYNDSTTITNNSTAATGLTLSGNAAQLNSGTLAFNGSGTTLVSGTITQTSGSTSLLKAGDGTLILNGANTYTGTTTIRAGTVQAGSNTSFGNAATNVELGDASTAGTDNIALLINDNSTIARALDVNNYGASTTIGGINAAGTATFSGTINLYKDLTLTAASGGTVAITGALNYVSGTNNIIKTGLGTVTLSNAGNDYNGATTISAGTLATGASNVLPTTTDVTIANGAVLNLGNYSQTIASLSGVAGSDVRLTGATNQSLTLGDATSTTFAGVIEDTGAGILSLTKNGTGTFTLSGNNTYAGNTTINNGTVAATSSTALGANNVGTVTVAAYATLALQGGIAISKDTVGTSRLTLNGVGAGSAGALRNISGNNSWAGDITLGSAASIISATAGNTLTIGNGSYTDTLTMGANTLTVDGNGDILFNSYIGAAGNTGAFVKNGTGTTTFTGNYNNYTGLTTVNQGALVLDTSSAFTDQTIRGNLVIGTGSGAIPANSAVVRYGPPSNNANKIANTSAITINSDGELDLNGNDDTVGAITLSGGHIATGTGILTLNADVATTTNAANRTAVVDGILYLGSATRTFNVASGGLTSDLTINARIDNGGIVKTGAGTMVIASDNITSGGYTGATTVSAGVLNIQNGNALGAVSSGTTVATGAALQLQGNIAVGTEGLTVNGTGISNDGALRNISGTNSWAGAVTFASAARVNTDAGSLTISGNIAAAANLAVGGAGNTTFSGATISLASLTKDGSGTLTITGAANYAGATTVTAGKLQFGTAGTGGAVTGGSAVTISNGATFDVENGKTTNAIGALAANAGSTLTIGSGTLITSGGTIAGSLTGSGTLQTSGNLAITSNNAFAGTLQATGGTLDLSGAGASFTVGTLTLGTGTTLKLGSNPLSVTTLNITGASTIDFGNGVSATLNVGTFNLGANTLSVSNWVNGADYFYAQNWSGATLGTRDQGPESQVSFAASTPSYPATDTAWLPYDPGDSDPTKRQITPAPEPSTYGAIFMGLSLLGLGFRRWRIRRQR